MACRPTHRCCLQLLAAAGMDKGALEEELALREEQHLVAEFRRNLEYNLGKVGGWYCGRSVWVWHCSAVVLQWFALGGLCFWVSMMSPDHPSVPCPAVRRPPGCLPAVWHEPQPQQPQAAPAPAAAGGLGPAGDAAGQGSGAAAALRGGAGWQPAGADGRRAVAGGAAAASAAQQDPVMRCAIPRDLAAICLLRPPFCCTPDSIV